MKSTDLRYLLAYTLPLCTLIAIHLGGIMSWLTVFVAFVIIPMVDLMLPVNAANIETDHLDKREQQPFFTWLLYGNIPLVVWMLSAFAQKIMIADLNTGEWAGLIFSTGVALGSNGINVAHELGHKQEKVGKIAAALLLMPSLYMHFTIEHNYGHHARVGTPDDPATARFGESLFAFYVRSIFGGWLSAWQIASARSQRIHIPFPGLFNKTVFFLLIQLVYLFSAYWFLGLEAMFSLAAAGILSILLLETINYVEHYGLERKKTPSGRYEPVELFHSWNSDHQAGRILLYELTRHSDHHYKAIKKYQVLNHHDVSPQLPFGYPASILLALVPPLWFKVMDPLVFKWRTLHATNQKSDNTFSRLASE